MLRGKIEGALDSNVISRNEYYGRCLEVAEWGRELWKDVPASVRSEVFDESFIRGLRNLYLQSILQVGATCCWSLVCTHTFSVLWLPPTGHKARGEAVGRGRYPVEEPRDRSCPW